MTFRSNFHARDDDVLLASFPKTGTTWLMALSHSILKKGGENGDRLATANPPSLPRPHRRGRALDQLLQRGHLRRLRASPPPPARSYKEPLPLSRAVECFCSGVHPSGPFSGSVAEYWLESQRRPEKVLFVKYEDIKSHPEREISRIAEFVGRPLKEEGEVEELLWRCSFERLKKLAANAKYFRKGQVGDWKNYLTSEMEDRIHQTVGLKLEALGLFLIHV
ncbi:hypothetical protein SASPL_147390 [Salvia splendens]|uniref:Sulfotransferase n=1 Tax=Salvia splendens TaxID=180675 RepID=A0A8X8WEI5_SALSN|nr:hypothetical protein SASPL_147390 [Salvia splendens]